MVGIGPGSSMQLTAKASQVLANADCVVSAKRHLNLVENHKNIVLLESFEKTFQQVDIELKKGSVAVMVSGDPGIHSLLSLVKKRFDNNDILVIPGISSLQSIFAVSAEIWENAVILSGHGRSIKNSKILDSVEQNRCTVFFCGSEKTPQWLCSLLFENGLNETEVIVGENLSYSNQIISRGKPFDLSQNDFDSLSIVLIINNNIWKKPDNRPLDEDFIRKKVPMTKEHIRSAILDTLRLDSDSIIWDIGSGSGSVTVAAGLFCTEGEVHAVECNSEAVQLTRDNVKKFHLHNVCIYEGKAAMLIPSLPQPSHVFIGGSGDELADIIQIITTMNKEIRVVISAVTLKTIAKAEEELNNDKFTHFDAVQINISHLKNIGNSSIMAANNPVTILSANTKSNKKEGRLVR